MITSEDLNVVLRPLVEALNEIAEALHRIADNIKVTPSPTPAQQSPPND